jgi:hypothetical protein
MAAAPISAAGSSAIHAGFRSLKFIFHLPVVPDKDDAKQQTFCKIHSQERFVS